MKPIQKAANTVILGQSVVNIKFTAYNVECCNGKVDFTVKNGSRFIHPYLGAPLFGDGKRNSSCPTALYSHVRGSELVPGGGLVHTAPPVKRTTPGQVVAIDAAGHSPEVSRIMAREGIDHRSIGRSAPRNDLAIEHELSNPSRPGRIVLRGPESPKGDANTAAKVNGGSLLESAGSLLLNSCQDRNLVAYLGTVAADLHVPQYSVLTPSLNLEDRIRLLLERSALSMANHEEWESVIEGLGFNPAGNDENNVSIENAGKALVDVMSSAECGDLIDTLGVHGALAGDRMTGAVFHVALRPQFRAFVKSLRSARRNGVTGIGDKFFGYAAVHHRKAMGRPMRVVCAALAASVRVVAEMVDGIVHPRISWFSVSRVASRRAAVIAA